MPGTASITWLGHATIRLTLPDERVILIDPWLTDNPACPDEFTNPTRCDFIALTHGHGDHTGDVARLIDRFNPHVVGTVELCQIIAVNHTKARFAPMNIGGSQEIDGVTFTLTRAFHSSSIDLETGPAYTGMPCGVIVSAVELASLYHAGDTDVFGDMKIIAELFAPKIVALPIGDHFTMGPRGAALSARYLQPEHLIPIHYGTFPQLHGTPEAFRDALSEDLKRKLTVPAVGAPIGWTADGLTVGS